MGNVQYQMDISLLWAETWKYTFRSVSSVSLNLFQVDTSLMDNIWKSLSDAKHDIKLLEIEISAVECTKRSLNDIRIEIRENEVTKIRVW